VILDPELRAELNAFIASTGAVTVSEAMRHALRLGLSLTHPDRGGGYASGVREGRMAGIAEARAAILDAMRRL